MANNFKRIVPNQKFVGNCVICGYGIYSPKDDNKYTRNATSKLTGVVHNYHLEKRAA